MISEVIQNTPLAYSLCAKLSGLWSVNRNTFKICTQK